MLEMSTHKIVGTYFNQINEFTKLDYQHNGLESA